MTTATPAADRAAALDRLRELFPVGSLVTTHVQHVSASGMTRAIMVMATVDGLPQDVSHLVARAGVARLYGPSQRGLRVTGCGMDMAFSLVYDLSWTLYGDGYALTRHAL